MSAPATRPRRGGPPSDRPFRSAYVRTIAVLGVLCLVFLGLTWFQGPKLSSAQVDTAVVVERPGQQLRMFANQQVAQVDHDQVSISPAADFSVSTQGDIISIVFEQRLHYGAHYVVEVDGVTSLYQNQPSTLRHEFTTTSAPVFFLDRADPATGNADSIMAGRLGGDALGELEIVYSAQRILDFTVVGQVIAVVTELEDKSHHLGLVSLTDGAVENVTLPSAGTIDELQGSDGLALGFRFTSGGDPLQRQFSKTLMFIDLEGSHVPQPLGGLDGSPLQVTDWRFMPNGITVMALSDDQSLLQIDPTGQAPILPLGTWEGLDDVSGDGGTLIVRDVYDTIILSLADGSEQPFGPSPIDGEIPFGGQVELLGNGPERVQKVSLYDYDAGVFSSRLVVDDGTEARVVYESVSGRGSIDDFSVSPNGQFVAVEVVPDVTTMVSDAYYPFARATSITTVIVELATGRAVAEVAGFALDW